MPTTALRRILDILQATMRTEMKRKKWTPEEYRAWRERHDARIRSLQSHIERIKAELAAKKSAS